VLFSFWSLINLSFGKIKFNLCRLFLQRKGTFFFLFWTDVFSVKSSGSVRVSSLILPNKLKYPFRHLLCNENLSFEETHIEIDIFSAFASFSIFLRVFSSMYNEICGIAALFF